MFGAPMALVCLALGVAVVVLVLVVAWPHVVFVLVLFPFVPYLTLPLRSMILAISSLAHLVLPWTSCGRHVLLWSNPLWVWVQNSRLVRCQVGRSIGKVLAPVRLPLPLTIGHRWMSRPPLVSITTCVLFLAVT